MRTVEEGLVKIRGGQAANSAESACLSELGLFSDGKLTPLGAMAAYNSSEFAWQGHYDPLEGLAEPPTESCHVLDLGSGSGQTMRRLFPRFSGTLVGVDADIEILAYGSKLFSAYGLPGHFCRASAHALPFATDTFDFVICRGVISYTHQRTAIREAFRVLRPDGRIFLRLESVVWDFRALTHPPSAMHVLFYLRSLAVGLAHHVTGLQAMPGGWVKGPRAYVPRRRFRQMVHEAGGEVLRYESSRRGPQFLGKGTQDVALCRKR
jgi:ubiquinone/menaquinone biosynthesis C-methylase UbiE